MTASLNSNHAAKSPAGERVAKWKKDVHFFFAGDWCRLRTLMMELEERSWSSDSAVESGQMPGQHGVIVPESRGSSDISALQHNGGTTDSELRTPGRDRLSALAEQIERRLQTANAFGK